MKKFVIFMMIIKIPFLTLMGQVQRYIEVDNLRYRIITEADGASTFGTVTLVAPEYEDEIYQGNINIPIAVKEFDDEYSDSYRVIGIDDGAFKNANNLGIVELPPSIENIGNHAFENSSLKEIIIPMGKLRTIGNYAFANCSIESIEFPSSVKLIGSGAFFKCSKLVNIGLKNGIVSLGDSIFYQCSNLRECILPETLTRIEDFSFWGCVNLRNIILGQKVKRIGVKAFQFCMNLRKLILPFSLIELGDYSLSHTGISEIHIPDRVKRIRKGTFFNSKMLRHVYLPQTLQTIEVMAFQNCKLYSINMPDIIQSNHEFLFNQVIYNGDDILERENKIKSIKSKLKCLKVNINDVVTLPIKDNIEMSSYRVVVGNNVYAILSHPDEKAEYGTLELLECNNFDMIGQQLPDIVEFVDKQIVEKYVIVKIGKSAFSNMQLNIQGLKLGTLIEELDEGAFAYSRFKKVELTNNIVLSKFLFIGSSIEECKIPLNATIIPTSTFEGCKQLKNIELPNTVEEIGEYAFKGSGINQIIIPEGVKVIDKGTFENCIDLKSVTFPSSLLYLKEKSFSKCGFENIIIPNTILLIDKYAFSECENLKEVILNDVTQIDKQAFYKTSIKNLKFGLGTVKIDKRQVAAFNDIEEVDFPSTTKVIGEGAFWNFLSLKKIYLPLSLDTIREMAFCNTSVEEIVIPNSVKYIGKLAFAECQNLLQVKLSGNTIVEMVAFNNSNIKRLIYSKESTEINSRLLLDSLKYIYIPGGVSKIGRMYFPSTIEEINIEEGVKYIEDYAFYGLNNLKSISIPSTVENIGNYAFNDCDNLKTVELKDGIKYIGKYAFSDSPINFLRIPQSVLMIGTRAFYKTNTVKICGDLSNWEYSVFDKNLLQWYQLDIPYLGDVKRYGLTNIK